MSGMRPALAVIVMLLVIGIVGGVLYSTNNGQVGAGESPHKVALAEDAPMCAPRADNPQRHIVPVGVQVVDFELSNLEGDRVRLSDELAKGPVLLEFFASWCPHCQESVDALHEVYEDGKVAVLAVNSGDRPGEPSTAAEYKEKYNIPYTMLDSPASTLLDKYCLEGFPLFYLLDKDGTVLWNHTGRLGEDKGLPELKTAIADLK